MQGSLECFGALFRMRPLMSIRATVPPRLVGTNPTAAMQRAGAGSCGAVLQATGHQVSATPTAAAPHRLAALTDGGVVQRAIGFEFELGHVETYRETGWIRHVPARLHKKHEIAPERSGSRSLLTIRLLDRPVRSPISS